MRGKLNEVPHPKECMSRVGSLSRVYFNISQEEYIKALEFDLIDTSSLDEEERYKTSDESTRHAVKAIVFSAMCLESAINDYAGWQLGDRYYESHLDSLDVVSKWVVIPKLVCGKELPKSGASFSALKKLVQARNQLVHNKSRDFEPSDQSHAKSVVDKNKKFEDDFKNSLKALYLMSMEMDYIVGQFHNPLRTLDPAFTSSRDIPELAKPLFDQCKNIILKQYT